MKWLDHITDLMDMSLSKLQELVIDSLACCSPWGHKELDTTERLNNNNLMCVCVNLQRSPLFLIHPYHGAVSGRTGSTRTCTFLKVKFCI